MKVILLQDVRGLGQRNAVKVVSDGYARNFLIPRKLAVPADATHIAQKQAHDADAARERAVYEAEAERLSKESFVLTVKTGSHGETFGSVSKKDLEEVLRLKGFSGVPLLEHAIKKTGDHVVPVEFKMGVKGMMKITLSPSPR